MDDTPFFPLLFPRFIEKKHTERTLCFFANGAILTEHGQRYKTFTFDSFVFTLFAHHLLLLTDSLFDTYLDECIAVADDVLCTKDATPLAIKLRGKDRSTRWILQSNGWGYPCVDEEGRETLKTAASLEMLQVMRAFFTHCGVGTLNSCGAVGQALMRRAWKEAYGPAWKEHRHERPSQTCCEELRMHLIGARSDVFVSKAEHIPNVRENDLKNAFASVTEELPTGRNFRFLAGSRPHEEYLIYYTECTVKVPQPLALGPFPVRGEDGLISFPVEPGTYDHVWLWSNEINQSREAGCEVITGDGHGWIETTYDMVYWRDLASYLRDTAPSPEVEFFVKKAMVAGLGRFYMPETKYVLSEEWGEGAWEVVREGLASTYWCVPVRDNKPFDMPHWYLWIYAQVRCKVYQEMLTRRQAGARLLASNTDAFFEDESVGPAPCYPCREQAKTGEWRVKSHRTIEGKASFPEKRHQNLVGAERHPGRK